MTVGLEEVDRFRTIKEATLTGPGDGPDGGTMEREESSFPLGHSALEAFIYSFT